MAKYTRLEVANAMYRQGLFPLFYHPDVEVGKKVLNACYAGGARLIEFTNRGDFAHEVFGELNKYALANLPGMMMGVGSVQDSATAALYMQLGACIIVTPVLREDIAYICNRRKVMWSPGCGSLTEIARAEELGCELVKLFPGETFGPAFIKAIKGPHPWTSIMPTGGVTPTRESLKEWFDAGASCVGIGSKLVSPEVLKNKDWDQLEELVRNTLRLIQEVRG